MNKKSPMHHVMKGCILINCFGRFFTENVEKSVFEFTLKLLYFFSNARFLEKGKVSKLLKKMFGLDRYLRLKLFPNDFQLDHDMLDI